MPDPMDFSGFFTEDDYKSAFPSIFLLVMCAFLMGSHFDPQEDLTEVKKALSKFNDFVQGLEIPQEVTTDEL